MKRIFYLLAFMLGICLTSCNKEEGNYQTFEQHQKQTYKEAFLNEFGEPAAEMAWGFAAPKQISGTRAHDVNGNQWSQNWETVPNITDEEREKVVAEFSKKRENTYNSQNFDYENFWVQQVYTGEQTYVDGFGNSIGTGSSHMNHLLVWNSDNAYDEEIYWPERQTIHHQGAYEHINNFNSGSNNTTYTDEVTNYVYKGTTLMKGIKNANGEVNKFGYHNSTDSKNHHEYIILNIDGAWYLGFDFYATHPEGQDANKNMDVERDWVFNDWIVKITPAVHKVIPPVKYVIEAGRVFCEDLGSVGDFDFNDAVFDVIVYSDGSAVITILAAGGTMPLTVAGVEVHNLFHVSTKTMVNTGAGASASSVTFESIGNYTCINDIKIFVQNSGTAYELEANKGAAPHKICVPVGTRWMKEYKNIQLGYPGFKAYVRGNGNPWGSYDPTYLY